MNVLNRGIDQGVEKPQFKCPQCPDKVYSSHHQLSNHTLEHIRVACDICGKSVRKPKLRHHKRAVHGEKIHFCPQCNLGFSIKKEINRHILNTHEKPHKCNLCGKGFGRESLLEEHKKIDHLGLKPYVCEFCQMAFKRSADWKGHLKRAHSKDKPFQCSKCSTTFTTTALLGWKYVF